MIRINRCRAEIEWWRRLRLIEIEKQVRDGDHQSRGTIGLDINQRLPRGGSNLGS